MRYCYHCFDILNWKCISNVFVKAVEPVNTSGLPFLLAFNLKKRHLYLLVTLQKRQPLSVL